MDYPVKALSSAGEAEDSLDVIVAHITSFLHCIAKLWSFLLFRDWKCNDYCHTFVTDKLIRFFYYQVALKMLV